MYLVRADERKRCGMNAKTRRFLVELKQIIDALEDFWPATVRSVFYAYIGRHGLPSDRTLYQKVSDVLLRARLDGEVPWEALEDRTRGTVGVSAWGDTADFVAAHRAYVLSDYRRDLQQGQAQRLEVWVEKDALVPIMRRAADPYTVKVAIARGFSSVSFKREAAERIRTAAKDGQRTVILYFGDLDPSGAYMPIDIAQALRDDLGVGELVKVYHCGLLPEQVRDYALPASVDALKPKDSRAEWFRGTYPGQQAVELDALASEPQVLLRLVQDCIESWLDVGILAEQRAAAEADEVSVAGLREGVVAAFDGAGS